MIPKIIHQVFLNGSLPATLRENVLHLKEMNPGWEHRLYDLQAALDDVRLQFGSEMVSLIGRINPEYGAARADLIRHLLVYAHGGVYLDIKSSVDSPIGDSLREDDAYILSQWRNEPGQAEAGFGLHRDLRHVPGGEYQTFHVIAEPEHGFSKAVIERIRRNIASYGPQSAVGRTGVLRTTGPIAYTLAIHPIRDMYDHRVVSAEAFGLRWTLGNEYNHMNVFKKHYSSLSSPVVTLDPVSTKLSAIYRGMRNLKSVARSGIRA